MTTSLSEKLKYLRSKKNVSQEKLAQYLGVSFQAVSKWETGITAPDILLLPGIARFYGITVDELLDVEQMNEQELFEEYREKAYKLYSLGRQEDVLALWREAHGKMPNNVEVKEMLMSSYYDLDKVEYKDEIISIATEIMDSDAGSYYKGQAIREAAITCHVCGNREMAEKWAQRSYMIHSCRESILYQIYEGKDLLDQVAFFTHWAVNQLFYMAVKVNDDDSVPLDDRQKNDMIGTVAKIYETVYPGRDMEFEEARNLFNLYICMAEYDAGCEDGKGAEKNLTEAYEIACSAKHIKAHRLAAPILKDWPIAETPNPNQIADFFQKELKENCYDIFREKEWFRGLINAINRVISES